MFLLLKQYRGNSLGYDGECVFALFNIICSNENAIVCIKRNEVSWEQTEMAADYTTLTIVSPNDILVKTCELDSKVRFRLKFNNVSPLCLLTLVYNLIFMISGDFLIVRMLRWMCVIKNTTSYLSTELSMISKNTNFI